MSNWNDRLNVRTDDTSRRSSATPLKGDGSEGAPPVRPLRVQTEIEQVVDLPLHNAFSLAATGKLLPQTVVHLLRNFRPNQPTPLHGAAFEWFLAKVEASADRLLGGLPPHWRERGREMAIDEVLKRFESGKLDIFEMSYSTAMRRICVDVVRYLRPRMRTELPIEDFSDQDGELTGLDAVEARVFKMGVVMPASEASAQLASALACLTDKERRVLLAIEMMDMTEAEVADIIGCGPRNIRHILKRAREKVLAGGTIQ